jgi:adenylate cyclase
MHLSLALTAYGQTLRLAFALAISTSQECHNPKFGRKMSFEIERKFLVLSDAWRNSAIRHTKIRQAYLDSNASVSIRVRIKDDNSAILTLKSRSSKLRRREFEYAIPILDAEELISLRRSCVIEKVRHIVPHGNLNWEVDVFSGENQGLVVAEIELPDENHQIELPPWVGPEVTGQDQYYNGTLAQHPYRSWQHHDAAVAAV